MLNNRNAITLLQLVKSSGMCNRDDLPSVWLSIPLPSRIVCDRGETASNISDLCKVLGIVVEIRHSFRPDEKGKVESAFRKRKDNPNV
jgi:hypothetical protein